MLKIPGNCVHRPCRLNAGTDSTSYKLEFWQRGWRGADWEEAAGSGGLWGCLLQAGFCASTQGPERGLTWVGRASRVPSPEPRGGPVPRLRWWVGALGALCPRGGADVKDPGEPPLYYPRPAEGLTLLSEITELPRELGDLALILSDPNSAAMSRGPRARRCCWAEQDWRPL